MLVIATSLEWSIAIVTLCGVTVTVIGQVATCFIQNISRRRIDEVNDAVNHRHERGGVKLYDLVWENHRKVDELVQWRRSYQDGPLDSGQKVVDFVSDFYDLKDKCDNNRCGFKDNAES